MGDTRNNRQDVTDIKVDSKSSVNALRLAKPSENIAVLEKTPNLSEEKIEKIHDEQAFVESRQKVETFFEGNLEDAPSCVHNEVDQKKNEHSPDTTKSANVKQPSVDTFVHRVDAVILKPSELKREQESKDQISLKSSTTAKGLDKKTRVNSATSGICQSERIIRNQSDIFSLKEETTIASAIFSVNGSPSRKVVRRKELAASNVFPFGQICKEEPPSDKITTSPRDKLRDTKESYNELKRPSSSARNPLTGTGLSSNDEYKFKGAKRKDGNPLLGLGYTPEATPSTHRIPPGGYSHKLW